MAPPVIRSPVVQAPPVAPGGDHVDESLRRADQARAARHYGAAAAQLRQAVQQTNDSRAPLAAFTLARLLLEKLNQPAEAARTFAEVQRLAPEGDLAEDALAREVESWRAAGLAAAARERAGTYLQRYPQGRRRGEVRRLGGVP
jgi:transmembrane sensor